MANALGILAMTIGLIRIEGDGDLRTLTATGATSSIRRSLTAATAGSLALLGQYWGPPAPTPALAAGYANALASLQPLPLVHQAVILIRLPSMAAVVGLSAGREPAILARQPIE